MGSNPTPSAKHIEIIEFFSLLRFVLAGIAAGILRGIIRRALPDPTENKAAS
ncbi:hypothetical protein [Bradyrhizobium sp. Ai1a-2]|uniref:hypothetical protein n=1 Tax=Bradyrhizobium sp. Ai1a-2 TaxID=196490 RepID=UPI0013637480|nr:hypothetical protein [Bradyrhizobium sp. Ai1a-2]